MAKARDAQAEKRKEPSYIPTAQNEYYQKYINANHRLNETRTERDNARLMVDVLFKTIYNIMPKYLEYIKILGEEGENK